MNQVGASARYMIASLISMLLWAGLLWCLSLVAHWASVR
jgi:hypothetical protein